MKKGEYIMLLIFVLLIVALSLYIAFKMPCEPISVCKIPSTNINCASDTDCFSVTSQGVCNLNTFKCVNMIVETDEEGCMNVKGIWYEEDCGLRKGK